MKTLIVFSLLVVFVLGNDPTIVSRTKWGATPSKGGKKLQVNPPIYVVIHHSADKGCTTSTECENAVKSIQKFHMTKMGWLDIGYNFLVGGDGLVYEGRGWGKHGAHLPKLNSKSLGICLLGNFQDSVPNEKQIQAAQDLIEYGKKNNLIASNYQLIGHRQGVPTQCPGDNLYQKIKNWAHWTSDFSMAQ